MSLFHSSSPGFRRERDSRV